METNSLQILGEAIFAFMLSTMSFTPQTDNTVEICIKHQDGVTVSCTNIPQYKFCGIEVSDNGEWVIKRAPEEALNF